MLIQVQLQASCVQLFVRIRISCVRGGKKVCFTKWTNTVSKFDWTAERLYIDFEIETRPFLW